MLVGCCVVSVERVYEFLLGRLERLSALDDILSYYDWRCYQWMRWGVNT